MPVKFWQTNVRFWFFLSYLITTVHKMFHCAESKVGRTMGGGELPKQQTKTYCYFYWHNRFFAPKSPEAASTAPSTLALLHWFPKNQRKPWVVKEITQKLPKRKVTWLVSNRKCPANHMITKDFSWKISIPTLAIFVEWKKPTTF